MNILVLLRVGRDPASFTVNRKAEKIFVHRDEWRTAPADLNALELALQLGEQGHTVMALALGGDEAAVALREARAMGATRALWVQADALRELDAGPLVAVLQHVIDYLGGAQLMLLGTEVPHADLAQMGPRLAVALGWPLLTESHSLAVDAAQATVTSTFAFGQDFETQRTALPALATVTADANQPRFAPAISIMRVHAEPSALERVSVAELGLEEAALKSLVTQRGVRYPPERTLGQVIEGSAEEAARRLLAELSGLD